jgi:hypothetical protein
MGLIYWTDSLINGDNVTQSHITTLKNDITTVVNGGLTNSNVNASAAIVESKIAFNTSSGHDHDGTDSKLIALGSQVKHFRKGLTLYGDNDENICVRPGTIDIGGTILSTTANSGDLAIATAGNWVFGAAAVSIWCYVYVYNNSNAIGYKFSTEAPDLSDASDNTTEIPFRYQKYASTYYRCIGCVFIDAAGDLCWGHNGSEGMYVSQFDASQVCIVNGLGTGSDQTMNTIWTPKFIRVIYGTQDTTPGVNDTTHCSEASQKMIDTNWYGTQLNAVDMEGGTHVWRAISDESSVNAITAQSAGVSGSFTLEAMTDDKYWYAIAYGDEP